MGCVQYQSVLSIFKKESFMFELVGKIVMYSVSGMFSIMIITWVLEHLSCFMKSTSKEHYAIRALSALLMTTVYIIILGLIFGYWKRLL